VGVVCDWLACLGRVEFPYTLEKGGYSTNELKAIIHNAEEGGYWAEVPALPGCVSEGYLGRNPFHIQRAAEGWLLVAGELGKSRSDGR